MLVTCSTPNSTVCWATCLVLNIFPYFAADEPGFNDVSDRQYARPAAFGAEGQHWHLWPASRL